MSRVLHAPCALFVALALPALASAGTIEIQLSGVNIAYDGSEISDADPGGGDPDPLVTVNFLVDSTSVGSVTTDISLDLSVPSVTGIAAGGDIVTSAPGGTFDIDLGADGSLELELAEATVTYVDVSGVVQFAFAGSTASIDSQSLPFGLTLGDPVTVSFSTQIIDGTLSTDGTFITGFEASGTGEVRGAAVPEPTAVGLIVLAVTGLATKRRRVS